MDLVSAMRSTVEWLRSNPKNHAKHTLARNAAGEPVMSGQPEACQFCAMGYLANLLGINAGLTSEVLEQIGASEGPERTLMLAVASFNDRKGPEAAADALETAIQFYDMRNTS